jgi:hypothetical protein
MKMLPFGGQSWRRNRPPNRLPALLRRVAERVNSPRSHESSGRWRPAPRQQQQVKGNAMLYNSRAAVGQGACYRRRICGLPFTIKQTGRPRVHCSDCCREVARQERDFRASAGRGSPAKAGSAVVAVGRGVQISNHVVVADHPQRQLVARAIAAEFAARWPTGLR